MRRTLAIAALALILGAGSAHGQVTAVTLDEVTGLSHDDTIAPGITLYTFKFRVSNTGTDTRFNISNGFRIYSPDGATWGIPTDTAGFLNEFGDMFTQADFRTFSYDGMGADTLGFYGFFEGTGGGLIDPYDSLALYVNLVEIGEADAGKTICIDSCSYRPSQTWGWSSLVAGKPNVRPSWSGPHCFTIGEHCCMGQLTGNVDYDAQDIVDLGDLTALIGHLFLFFVLQKCHDEANVDGDPNGSVDLGDLTALIDYLFISFTPPAACR